MMLHHRPSFRESIHAYQSVRQPREAPKRLCGLPFNQPAKGNLEKHTKISAHTPTRRATLRDGHRFRVKITKSFTKALRTNVGLLPNMLDPFSWYLQGNKTAKTKSMSTSNCSQSPCPINLLNRSQKENQLKALPFPPHPTPPHPTPPHPSPAQPTPAHPAPPHPSPAHPTPAHPTLKGYLKDQSVVGTGSLSGAMGERGMVGFLFWMDEIRFAPL